MTAPGGRSAAALARWGRAVPAGWSRTRRVVVDLARDVVRAVRTAPPRALVAGGTALALIPAATWMAMAVSSSPEESASRWMSTLNQGGPEIDPPPAHEPPRVLAVPPLPSPGAAPPPASDGSTTPLPPEVTGEFVAWAVMDVHTGTISGSDNFHHTSTTASMIKAWLVADYLGQQDGMPDDPARLDQLSAMIRHSDNEETQALFIELGEDDSIQRLINVCGLTDSEAEPFLWSNTRLSPRDTARMGACIATGQAAGGPERTEWLLSEMRQVDEWGSFGIVEALPPDQQSSTAIKNGWVVRTEVDEYHVNCLAIGDGWTMGVLTRYPAELGRDHGAEICRSLAAEHLP